MSNIRYRHWSTALHLLALRGAAKTGHIRRASMALGAIFPERDVDIALENGHWFTVPVSDSYWSRILVGWEYEPGVRDVIDAAIIARPDAVFLDCGANFGYWSTWACDRVDTIAIEAVPTTYARLKGNADGGGFTAINAAVWDSSDAHLQVTWAPKRHAAASVTSRQGPYTARIPTVTIDQLSSRFDASRPIIVKLDIEGAEARALAGASAVGQRTLFLYEDHGGDRRHSATRAFLEKGFRVWHIDASAQVVTTIARLEQIKQKRTVGYNFAACRGPMWFGLLLS